jgi:hypothetical protein
VQAARQPDLPRRATARSARPGWLARSPRQRTGTGGTS